MAAGCGSNSSSSSSASRAEFKAGFATSQREFRKLGTTLAKDITRAGSRTDAQLAKEFGALATRARQQAADLAAHLDLGVTAPRSKQRGLVCQVGQVGTDHPRGG